MRTSVQVARDAESQARERHAGGHHLLVTALASLAAAVQPVAQLALAALAHSLERLLQRGVSLFLGRDLQEGLEPLRPLVAHLAENTAQQRRPLAWLY
jgi:hypothetical protein